MRLEYFSLIDRIIEVDLVHRKIRAEAAVPLESSIFEGHFPGFPIMPGVLLLETMAQASGWLVIAVTGFSRMPFLAAVKDAKLRSFVSPGATLAVDANLVHEGSGYCVTSAAIRSEGRPVCNCEITFRLVEFPNPQFRAALTERASAIAFPMDTVLNG
jgi:3-hydroxyacyl-[acyl-carrier-protein] dehydratase